MTCRIQYGRVVFLSSKSPLLRKSKIMSSQKKLLWETESPKAPDGEDSSLVKDYTGCEYRMHNFQTSHPEPYWNKQHLPFLYENVDYKGFGSDTEMFGKFRKNQPTTIIKTQVYSEVDMQGNKQLLHEVEWKVLCKGGLTDNRDVKELCSSINSSNPYLWGARHNNRFRRGTKVWFRAGEYKNMHGVVVGPVLGFDITAHPDTVIHSYVMLPSERIVKVRQDYMKLVDLHHKLPFGIPRPLSELKKKKQKQKTGAWASSSGWEAWKESSAKAATYKTQGWMLDWKGSCGSNGWGAPQSCKRKSDDEDEKPKGKRNRNE